ncbi:metal ABC transporter ATP-binding protein [Saccharicrinis sp. FJH54]|uniref:metal ABC transporter ATP-binding protein n=1 Tax=Saccharicrinis sp. FJH54 TaxID=3344665 RepID=UPI0035D48357
MSKILELSDISAGYDKKRAIEGISLTINQNDFIGFIGPNGGGKTTLVKVIVGLLQPERGKMQAYRNNKPSDKLRVGYLAQKNQIDQQFPIRVREVVASGTSKKWSMRYSKKDLRETDALLEQLHLTHLKGAAISEISGGEMQRALLGRAIISNPDLLLLDEPNTYLDQHSEDMLYSILNDLNTRMAIILVSHDLGIISSYVKTIACINYTMHYHPNNEITEEMLESYQCPVELITHGKVPHRVLKTHIHE